MSNSLFSSLKNKIEKLSLKRPAVSFKNHSVILKTKPGINNILDLIILLIFSCVFIINLSLLWLSVIAFAVFCHKLFLNFKGCNIIIIETDTETIIAKNYIPFITLYRKMWGIRTKHTFSSLKDFSIAENSMFDRLGFLEQREKHFILLETFVSPAFVISELNTREEANALISILKKNLLYKEKI